MTSCPRCRRTYEEGVRFCPVDGALVTQAVHDPNLGRMLMGQFELREVAGRGAMGTVYRAFQRTMDRVVAVKILRAEIMKEPGVLKRFLREARAAARLQHPNIVTVHMVGETEDGVPYLVMEHIDGVSLEAICEAQGPQPILRTISFGRQIASALSEAHSLGIVHRDLKPANILVTDRSRTPDLLKVLDFGIAKLINTDADQSMMTADGTIFGTPHYIAPEQASGAEVDNRADLYSLGCILFRLTTGVLPFEGTQSMQVVLKHLREEPPRPRSIDPAIPQAMEDLILSCLDKQRGRRPVDAEAIIGALDRIEADVRRPKTERLPPVVVPRERVVTPASQPVAPVVAQAAMATPSRGTSAPRDTGRMPVSTAAARRSPWSSRGVWIGVFLAATMGAGAGVLAALTHNAVDEPMAPPAPEHPAVPRNARAHVPAGSVVVTTAPAEPGASDDAPGVGGTAAVRKDAPRGKDAIKQARNDGTTRRHARNDDGELPMTVVAPDPPAAPRVVSRPLPANVTTTSAPATTTVVSPPATAPAPVQQPTVVVTPRPTTPNVVVAPPPPQPKEPSASPPKDDEPPPAPPPAANDPTTIPAPSPQN